jgi:hypothetical protein
VGRSIVATSGGPGALTKRSADVDNTSQTAKSSSGRVYGYHVYNPNSSDAWLHLYDSASAVTPGTTTPTVSLWVPAQGALDAVFPLGLEFEAGIKYAATTTVTGGTDPTTGLVMNLFYR